MTKQEIKDRIEQLVDLIENSNRKGRAYIRILDWQEEVRVLRWRLRNKQY